MLRDVNMTEVEEGSAIKTCLQLRYDNINEINTLNDQEIKECIATEENTMQANEAINIVLRRGIDDATKKIIKNLEKCLEVKDNLESTKCTANYDSNNNDLTDNSGLAVKTVEHMIAENANIKAERRYCVDTSLRTAQKKISEEQKGIQSCLSNKQWGRDMQEKFFGVSDL